MNFLDSYIRNYKTIKRGIKCRQSFALIAVNEGVFEWILISFAELVMKKKKAICVLAGTVEGDL